MNNLSIEDLVAYTTFTHSKNFSKLIKIAIDKYCTDIDKTIELQKFLMEKPKELINEYEKKILQMQQWHLNLEQQIL